MEKGHETTEEKTSKYRSQLRSESCYDDGLWEKNWKEILPKAPEKPSEETGVWRLADEATDWKDISDDLADIPQLRPRPRNWLTPNDQGCDKFFKFLPKKCHDKNKKPVRSSARLARKPVMCDKEIQTDPTDDDEQDDYYIPLEHFICIM